MNNAQVIKDLEMAAAHYKLASELTYKASKYLRDVSTSGTLKEKKSALSDEQVAELLAKSDKRKQIKNRHRSQL